MNDDKLKIYERALKRERAARKEAEAILEQKSAELFSLTQELTKSNLKLESLVLKKTSQLKGVFHNIVDAFVVMNLKGDVLEMNEAATKLFGYDLEKEPINVVGLIYKEDLMYAMASYNELIEHGFFTNYRARIFSKDREVKWVHINASLIYDEHNEPIGAQGIVRDITEAELSAATIAEQQKKLSAIVDYSSLGIILTQNASIIQTNKKAQELLGYSEEDLLDLEVKDVSIKEDFPLSKDYMDKMNNHGLNHFVIKKRYVRKDGSHFWAKTNVAAVRNEDNSILYQVALIEDITEQLKNEADRQLLVDSIEAQKQKYGNIIANMNLGLLEVNNEDEILMANQSFEEMSGYSEDELVGKKAAKLLLVEESISTIESENSERRDGKSNSYEVVAKLKSGETRHWLVSGAPNYDFNGDVIGSIGIHLDITQLKSLEIQKENLLQKLEKSNDELQEYAHVVSHDLKSPLRSIYALVEWMKEDNEDSFDETTIQNLGLIETTLEKMEQLISDVLLYSSFSADETKRSSVDLNVLIEEIKQTQFFPDHISLLIKTPLPVLNVDSIRIQQLFQNLISNAVRYIDKEEGIIEIDVVDNGAHYEFSIRDNGIGIEKKFHQKIFKMFQSLHKTKESTGIGLAIVKKIVDSYQGDIWLESTVGEGSTFFFTIKK